MKFRHDRPIARHLDGYDLSTRPSLTITATGMSNLSNYWIEIEHERRDVNSHNKPPYRVPLMREIASLPWNGYRVASTFSGCGGSCTGYRMAGFKVAWANEFVPAAQDSYRANADESCFLDCRDIKLVQPEDVLAQIGLGVGELDLFDGSPPCQAFSLAGKRERGWGEEKKYEHGASQRNETLFDEYIRLLRGLRPKMFVAENVAGLVTGTAKGYFLDILSALKACGYRVAVRVLDAQWLGVPQRRRRVIFIGVREEFGVEPEHPSPLPYQYSVAEALPWIDSARQDPCEQFAVQDISANQPSFSRKFTIPEVMRLCSFPDDFVLTGTYSQQWERLGNSVPPMMAYHIGLSVRRVLDKIHGKA